MELDRLEKPSSSLFVLSVLCASLWLVCAPVTVGQQADSSWASYQADKYNSGQSVYDIPSNPQNLFKLQVTGNINSSPVIDDRGNIYIGTEQGWFYAISPVGFVKWSYEFGNTVSGSAAIGEDGTIYVPSTDANLYALNPNGSLIWKFNAGSGFATSPVISQERTIYVGTADSLYALTEKGKLKWRYDQGFSYAPSIDSNGTVYATGTDGLYAISPAGSLKWKSAKNYQTAPVIGKEGTIYAGTFLDTLFAFQADGQVKWSYEMEEAVVSPPAIGQKGTIFLAGFDKRVQALTPAGSLKWKKQFDGFFRMAPRVGASGNLLVSEITENRPPTLYALHSNSQIKWKTDNYGYLKNISLGVSGTIYATNRAQRSIFALGTNDTLRIDDKLNPPDSNMVNTRTPAISWESITFPMTSGEVSYDLFFSADSNLSSAQQIETKDTSYQVKDSLKENHKYYWYVKAFNGQGDSTFSYLNRFWVNSKVEAPREFDLNQPQDSSVGLETQPRLKWEETTDPDPLDTISYEVTIATDQKLKDTVLNQFLPQYVLFWSPREPLADSTRYFWTVEAQDRFGLSTYSDTLTFVVGTLTNIESPEELPDAYKLYNPYPSPFNPQTTIKYDLPKASAVSVKAYNILGQHVRTLVNEKQSAGTYTVRFKAGNLPSGQYLIRMQAGEFVQEKAVILVK